MLDEFPLKSPSIPTCSSNEAANVWVSRIDFVGIGLHEFFGIVALRYQVPKFGSQAILGDAITSRLDHNLVDRRVIVILQTFAYPLECSIENQVRSLFTQFLSSLVKEL